jgi:Na+-transporting methylmalonyl-CoA/oxaloacetate decarboxylase gamma subunit
VGLLITFIALGVFIGVIYLLKAVFPYKPEAEEEGEGEEAEEVVEITASDDDEEMAAAIAAVLYLKEGRPSSITPGKNTFWTAR